MCALSVAKLGKQSREKEWWRECGRGDVEMWRDGGEGSESVCWGGVERTEWMGGRWRKWMGWSVGEDI